MANVTVKGIPDDIYERLKQEAESNHRSVNREIIHRLERSVSAPVVDADRYLADLEALHGRASSLPHLTDELLRSARDYGRP